MLTVIHGPDRALARRALSALLAEADPGDDNTSQFEAPGDSVQTVISALATPSFFGNARVIVAQGHLSLLKQSSGGKTKRSKSSSGGGIAGDLETLIVAAQTQGTLIFYEPDLATLPAAAKSLMPEGTTISGHAPPRGSELIDFTRSAAQERRSSIDRETARYLLNRLFPGHWSQPASNPAFDRPPDIAVLLTELDKLAIAAGAHGIDEQLIDELTLAASSDRVFTLLDAVVSGDRVAALRELNALPDASDDQSRMLAMIAQQVEFAAAAGAQGRPSDPLQAGKALGMSNPNRMKAILQSTRNRESQETLLESTIDADRRLKTGLDSTAADSIYRIISRDVAGSGQPKRGE